ncbi:MAG: hypothetical protein HY290_30375 [Planctomycetia bacterium]|nr:hypothetical protein [Planctomycetia bacterium]
MSRRILWACALLAGLAGGGAALWWMLDDEAAPETRATQKRQPEELFPDDIGAVARPLPTPTDYAGSQSCRECHRELWEGFQKHPMSHSMFPADDTSPSEDFEHETTFAAGRRKYRVERTAEGIRHHEIVDDAGGETIYDQAVAVQYAVGSAKRGRSYFIDRGGLFFMSPISWYSEADGGKWDLSPNYPPAGHLRFERRIVDACVACHSGAARPRAGAPDRFEKPPFAELSIGCERCHGPGQKHVNLRRAGHAAGEPDPIVNPALLDSSRRDAVCYQCHLLGQERVLQYGRTEYDFRPGMHLGDVWAVLVEGTGIGGDDSTEAVSQAEQMMSSRCYEGSGARLGCISCHDPHSYPVPPERVDFYRTKCLACHAERGCSETADARQVEHDSCIACHMPRLHASDVPHTSQTDHRVLKSKGSPLGAPVKSRPAKSRGEPDPIRLFESGTPGLAERAERRARGILLSMLAERQKDPLVALRAERMLAPFARAAPDDLAVLDALAVAAAIQRRPADAAARWNAILAVAPTHERALESLAVQSIAANRPADALMYLERYLIVNPWNSGMHVQRSRQFVQIGLETQALQAAQRALELDPSQTDTYNWLAELCERVGRPDEGRRYRDLQRRIEQQPAN